jgi:hypothetical protein
MFPEVMVKIPAGFPSSATVASGKRLRMAIRTLSGSSVGLMAALIRMFMRLHSRAMY